MLEISEVQNLAIPVSYLLRLEFYFKNIRKFLTTVTIEKHPLVHIWEYFSTLGFYMINLKHIFENRENAMHLISMKN